MNRTIKKIIILISLLVFYSCVGVNGSLKLGKKLSKVKFKYERSSNSAYINAGYIGTTYKTSVGGGIIYHFSVNEDGIIDYIKTYSDEFRTSENIAVNDDISKCLKYSEKGLVVEAGICFFVPLPSGWSAVFGDISMDIESIKKSGKVIYFFKKFKNLSREMTLKAWQEYIYIDPSSRFVPNPEEMDVFIVPPEKE